MQTEAIQAKHQEEQQEYWQHLLHQASIAAMQALIKEGDNPEHLAYIAVKYAKALIKELQ